MSVPISSTAPYMSSIMLTLARNVKPLGINLSVRELDHTQWSTHSCRTRVPASRYAAISPYAALLLPAAMIVVTAGRINMLGDPTREAAAK